MGAGNWVVNAASLNHKLPARWLLYEMENSLQILKKKKTQNKNIYIYMYIPLARQSAEKGSGLPVAKRKNIKTQLNRHLNRGKRVKRIFISFR